MSVFDRLYDGFFRPPRRRPPSGFWRRCGRWASVADGPVKFWFYDDPLTPFWKRRNEVSVHLAP